MAIKKPYDEGCFTDSEKLLLKVRFIVFLKIKKN